MQLSSSLQVIETIENEPTKFGIFTSDHRLHLKTTGGDAKMQWVNALSIAMQNLLKEEEAARVRSLSVATRLRSAVKKDDISRDLKEKAVRSIRSSPFLPRRPNSPFSSHRINIIPPRPDSPANPPQLITVSNREIGTKERRVEEGVR